MTKHINNQGSGGHFDGEWQNFREAVDDPLFKKLVLKRMQDLEAGRPVSSYTTCRDKRETKAKKNLHDGRLLVPGDLKPKILRYFGSEDQRSFREKRRQYLREQTMLAPRNIRFTEFVQRAVDIMILGPIQYHHNHVEKLNMGSTTGVPMWLLGDLVRKCYDAYLANEHQEFKCYPPGEKKFNEHPEEEGFVEFASDEFLEMRRDALLKKKKVLIASGDFSGYDGTISKTDLAINCHSYLAIYQRRYHTLVINRFCLYMWNFTITDYGHIVLTVGQRASGDQDTSKGNTEINDVVHTAATAFALGITCEEACAPIGYVHYKSGFTRDENCATKTKSFVLRRITHAADGDDNIHFGYEDDIKGLNKAGSEFINRIGKKLRCGDKPGYAISEKFSDLQFCSHGFEKIRIGKIKGVPIEDVPFSKRPFNGTIGDRTDIFQKEWQSSLKRCEQEGVDKTIISTRAQHLFDLECGLRVTYKPSRPYSEILGKYVFTLKNDVVSFDPTRAYGSTSKEEKRGRKNERAHEITRGKTLSYILNYAHIAFVQVITMGVMSVIGDGTCDLHELKRRYNVPSTYGSLINAIRMVHGVDSLLELERPSPNYERGQLRIINENTKLTYETGIIEGIGKVAPTNLLDLYKQTETWVKNFTARFEMQADWRFLKSVCPPNLREQGYIGSSLKIVTSQQVQRDSKLTSFLRSIFCCFGVKPIPKVEKYSYREHDNVIFCTRNGEVFHKLKEIAGVNVSLIAQRSNWKVGDIIPINTQWNTLFVVVHKESFSKYYKPGPELESHMVSLYKTVSLLGKNKSLCFLTKNKKIDKVHIRDLMHCKGVRKLQRSRKISYFSAGAE